MRRGVGVLPLKKQQNPQVGLSIQIFGFQLDQRLKFRNGEFGPPLVEILLGKTRVRGSLVLG
jgi:hypothetical protein